jgi:hypothetical protein
MMWSVFKFAVAGGAVVLFPLSIRFMSISKSKRCDSRVGASLSQRLLLRRPGTKFLDLYFDCNGDSSPQARATVMHELAALAEPRQERGNLAFERGDFAEASFELGAAASLMPWDVSALKVWQASRLPSMILDQRPDWWRVAFWDNAEFSKRDSVMVFEARMERRSENFVGSQFSPPAGDYPRLNQPARR